MYMLIDLKPKTLKNTEVRFMCVFQVIIAITGMQETYGKCNAGLWRVHRDLAANAPEDLCQVYRVLGLDVIFISNRIYTPG